MGKVVAAAVAVLVAIGLAATASGPRATVAFAFADPAIVESSGLVARGGLFVTVNDSGDTGRVFAVDPASGETVGVTTWSDDPTDVEAVAPADDGQVWVGDIGDNLASRDSVTVVKVPVGRGDRDVAATAYRLSYPGGPQDAETLLVEPGTGRLVVVTKGVFGGDVFMAPATLEPDRVNRMRRVGAAMGIATDGSFFPDGRHLVIRGYASATVYTWPALDEVDRFDLPAQEQGEGIAVAEDDAVFVSSEGVGSEVLRLTLPRVVRTELEPPPPATSAPTDTDSQRPSEAGEGPGEGPGGSPGSEPGAESAPAPPVWPWLLGGVVGLALVGVLVRALRPRG